MTTEEIERIWEAIQADEKPEEDRAKVQDRPLQKARVSAQFVAGWHNAFKERVYKPETLKLLHWNNLGYRYEKFCASPLKVKDEEVRDVFEYLVEKHDGQYT